MWSAVLFIIELGKDTSASIRINAVPIGVVEDIILFVQKVVVETNAAVELDIVPIPEFK